MTRKTGGGALKVGGSLNDTDAGFLSTASGNTCLTLRSAAWLADFALLMFLRSSEFICWFLLWPGSREAMSAPLNKRFSQSRPPTMGPQCRSSKRMVNSDESKLLLCCWGCIWTCIVLQTVDDILEGQLDGSLSRLLIRMIAGCGREEDACDQMIVTACCPLLDDTSPKLLAHFLSTLALCSASDDVRRTPE